MKVVSSFVLLLTAVTVFASDLPPEETHQVLYLADAGAVVLRLSVVVEGEGPKQCQEKFVDAMLKTLDKNGDGVVTVEEARVRIPTPREAQQLQLGTGTEPVAMDAVPDSNPKDGKITRGELLAYFKRIGLSPFSVQYVPRQAQADPNTGAMANAATDAPLFDRLDANSDKKLSKDELGQALEVLRKLDRDDDETISAIELQEVPNQAVLRNPRAMNNNTAATPNPFVSLSGGESIQKLIRRVIDKFDSADAAKWTAVNITIHKAATLRLNVSGPGEFSGEQVGTLLGNLTRSVNDNELMGGSFLSLDTTNATQPVIIAADLTDSQAPAAARVFSKNAEAARCGFPATPPTQAGRSLRAVR